MQKMGQLQMVSTNTTIPIGAKLYLVYTSI